MTTVDATLHFWFEACTPQQWFKKDPEFDADIASRFGDYVERALAGELDDWGGSDSGCMALILLLDQFTRNIYRDTPAAFSGDAQSLSLSQACVDRGYLETSPPRWCQFMLTPMMHSESLTVQDASLPLFEQFTTPQVLGYAVAHRDIIARFGRFPHRNEIVGRQSTPEEVTFLTQPGSRF